MFYNPSDSTASAILKHLSFWIMLFTTFGLCAFLLRDDIKIPQREVTLKVNIDNKINVCAPDESDFEQKPFFKLKL